MNDRPRYTSRDLPPYSYVPGHAPHPVSHPDGHMHGIEHGEVAPMQPSHWQDSETYLYGIDLFNHGFYWESHEAWESLWLAAGRTGMVANFLKGLIKLAAAAVKAREGNPRGVSRHMSRAKELLDGTRTEGDCGLDLKQIVIQSQSIGSQAELFSQGNPTLLLDLVLEIADD